MLAGILAETSGADRLVGYKQALRAANIPFSAELVAEGDWTESGGYQQVMKLLAIDDPPTALMISSSLMAVGALMALRDRALSVPGQIAVCCFDDVPWGPLIEPPLTVLGRQDYNLGATAAALILEQLGTHGSRHGRDHLLPMSLVIRRSCGCVG